MADRIAAALLRTAYGNMWSSVPSLRSVGGLDVALQGQLSGPQLCDAAYAR